MKALSSEKYEDGDRLPWYYGYCYLDYRIRRIYFTIIPFNYICRWLFYAQMQWFRIRNKKSWVDVYIQAQAEQIAKHTKWSQEQMMKAVVQEEIDSLMKELRRNHAYPDSA